MDEMQDWIGHCLRLLAWIGCVRATLRCCHELIEPEVVPLGEPVEGPMTSPGTWVRRSPAGVWGQELGPSWGHRAHGTPHWHSLTRRPLRLFSRTLRLMHHLVNHARVVRTSWSCHGESQQLSTVFRWASEMAGVHV